MIRALWLRYKLHCLRTQEEGLRQELAGVQYMLSLNAEQQRRALSDLSLAQMDARFRVAK